MRYWMRSVLLVSVAYVVAGRLGQYLAIPPDYATAFWPAAGIALASLLILGQHVWPGVFLGALIVNSWTPLMLASDASEIAVAFGAAASIAMGATIQAAVGCFLIRRYTNTALTLIHEREIFTFLGLGGPVACVFGASQGVATLIAAGKLDLSHIGTNWWVWWIGDVIGVIVFAPLTLIMFAKPKHVWKQRRVSVALPLLATLGVVAASFVLVNISEQRGMRIAFERRAELVHLDLQEHVDGYLGAVHSTKGLYDSSSGVSRSEFSMFTQPLLDRHPGIQALEWLPRVRKEDREKYESLARQDGFPNFGITEQDREDHNMRTAADRSEYLPVFYIEPYVNNELALGFDLMSDLNRRQAMELARDANDQVATPPITLVQDRTQQAGFLVIHPVYHRNVPIDSINDRRRQLRGYVLGVFGVDDIVDAVLNSVGVRDFEVTIVDESSTSEPREIYTSAPNSSAHKASEVIPLLRANIHWSGRLPIAGRAWRCRFVPNDKFFASQRDSYMWLSMIGGLSFTGLLGALLLTLTGSTARIENVVVQRTRELSEKNQELQNEIVARKQAELELSMARDDLEQRVEERTSKLKESESRYQDLYDNAPDMFVTVDLTSHQVFNCNRTFLDATGYGDEEIIGRNVLELCHSDSIDDARRAYQAFLATGKIKDVELRLRRKNAEPLTVCLNVSTVRNSQGGLLYGRAVIRDITDQRKAEAKIKLREAELAHVARLCTMGEMAAGLAHEINQPLAAITAYAEGTAVRLQRGAIDPDTMSSVIENIAADAHRAGEVMRRLRRFLHKREPEVSEVDINRLVVEVTRFVAAEAVERDVRIKLLLAEDLPRAMSDTVECQQVLLNLVRNSFDAIANSPTADCEVAIRTTPAGRFVEIVVEDHGPGISRHAQEQVFEPFYTSKVDGLGMGLAISRSIVESHGGRIWISNSARAGTAFHFTLPIADVLALN